MGYRVTRHFEKLRNSQNTLVKEPMQRTLKKNIWKCIHIVDIKELCIKKYLGFEQNT